MFSAVTPLLIRRLPQGAMFKNETVSKEMIKFSGALTRETVVDVKGTIVKADVKSCTQSDVELSLTRVYVVSRAEVVPPASPLSPQDDLHCVIGA